MVGANAPDLAATEPWSREMRKPLTRVLSIATATALVTAALVAIVTPAQGASTAQAAPAAHVTPTVASDVTPSGTIAGHVSLGTADHPAAAGEVAVVYSTNGDAKYNCCTNQTLTDANGDYSISPAYVGQTYFLYFKYLG